MVNTLSNNDTNINYEQSNNQNNQNNNINQIIIDRSIDYKN